jgi:CBS domain-containing protein
MNVREAMTTDVRVIEPDESISEAARLMAELDIGSLPVAQNDRLVGMITDRDIAVRAVAQGRGPDTPVADIMTKEVAYCYDDLTLDEVSRNMADIRVRRLPVVNREKRLVGILALSDLALGDGAKDEAAEALRGISRPGGRHSQGATTH